MRDWTAALLANLDDPTVARSIEQLGDLREKQAVTQFIKRRELPRPLRPTLLRAVQHVLAGLETVVLTPTDLRSALVNGGIPCTIGELKDRFDRYIADLTGDREPARVRVLVE